MSNSRKANLLAAVAKRQRFANLWHCLESGNTLTGPPGSELRRLSSNARSSRHYDSSNVSRSNRIPSAKPLNGIPKGESNRKRANIPPENRANGEAVIESTLQVPKEEHPTMNHKAEAHKVNGESVQPAHSSPSELVFTGDTLIPVTSRLHIVTPEEDTPRGVWPIFRIMVSHFNLLMNCML